MMKPSWWKGLLVISLCMIPLSLPAADEKGESSSADYVIGVGDILDISVWKNEEMSKVVTVLPDGSISFPLIGNIVAAEKTVGELKKELDEKISAFIPNPTLSVVVSKINSMFIFVNGRVNNPGRFALDYNINVMQALSMAGGLTPFAKRNKIKIFRKENDVTQIFVFRFDDIVKGKNLEQNIALKRGDTILVP